MKTLKTDRREELKKIRLLNKQQAMKRDDGCCVACFSGAPSRRVPAVDVHHVYGRSQDPESFEEDYRSLMSLCRYHHDTIHRSTWIWGTHIRDLLDLVNRVPINSEFKHLK